MHTFPKGISTMGTANSTVQDSTSPFPAMITIRPPAHIYGYRCVCSLLLFFLRLFVLFFNGISIFGYIMQNPVYTYIMIFKRIVCWKHYFLNESELICLHIVLRL